MFAPIPQNICSGFQLDMKKRASLFSLFPRSWFMRIFSGTFLCRIKCFPVCGNQRTKTFSLKQIQAFMLKYLYLLSNTIPIEHYLSLCTIRRNVCYGDFSAGITFSKNMACFPLEGEFSETRSVLENHETPALTSRMAITM